MTHEKYTQKNRIFRIRKIGCNCRLRHIRVQSSANGYNVHIQYTLQCCCCESIQFVFSCNAYLSCGLPPPNQSTKKTRRKNHTHEPFRSMYFHVSLRFCSLNERHTYTQRDTFIAHTAYLLLFRLNYIPCRRNRVFVSFLRIHSNSKLRSKYKTSNKDRSTNTQPVNCMNLLFTHTFAPVPCRYVCVFVCVFTRNTYSGNVRSTGLRRERNRKHTHILFFLCCRTPNRVSSAAVSFSISTNIEAKRRKIVRRILFFFVLFLFSFLLVFCCCCCCCFCREAN